MSDKLYRICVSISLSTASGDYYPPQNPTHRDEGSREGTFDGLLEGSRLGTFDGLLEGSRLGLKCRDVMNSKLCEHIIIKGRR